MQPSFFEHLEDRLNLAVYDINAEYRMGLSDVKDRLAHIPGIDGLKVQPTPGGTEIYSMGDRSLEVPAGDPSETVWIQRLADGLQLTPTVAPIHFMEEPEPVFFNPTAEKPTVASTPISRLKEKLAKASGVAQRVATQIEGEADGLIAQEDAMKSKTANAFAPHKAILAEATTELQAIEDALNLMSNGGPPLDPLPDAGHTEPVSKPADAV